MSDNNELLTVSTVPGHARLLLVEPETLVDDPIDEDEITKKEVVPFGGDIEYRLRLEIQHNPFRLRRIRIIAEVVERLSEKNLFSFGKMSWNWAKRYVRRTYGRAQGAV